MNVFEDLVVELKEANLLEHTVMDLSADSGNKDPLEESSLESFDFHETAVEEATNDLREPVDAPETPRGPDQIDELESAGFETGPDKVDGQIRDQAIYPDRTDLAESIGLQDDPETASEFPMELPASEADSVQASDILLQGNEETVAVRQPNSDREFFKKRAAAEMSSLKMVEAVVSAIEREHLKIIPNAYDDLEAKKALHAFQQITGDASSDDHKAAEFGLLNETQLWCSALAERDASITVANIRRYCETCRPMLSSQAMLAVARFYRNLPYTENVRGKFDFVITRLFSRQVPNETRNLLFNREEMLNHVKTLYADWSSVPLYNAEDDDSQILLTALSFEEMSAEAESAASFDDLIKSDFFGRLRMFKESIAEIFFAPVVTASAIEANVRIGNVYVKLIDCERKKMDSASIHQRFGHLDDQTVSEAVSRTLELVQILRERANDPVEDREYVEEVEIPSETIGREINEEKVQPTGKLEQPKSKVSLGQRLKEEVRSVNRLFLVSGLVLIAVSIGLYIWASASDRQISTAGVKTLSFQGTDLGENVKVARLSGETLYIVGQPAVDTMPKDKLTELLQKLYWAGKEKGWLNVNLMNSEGKTVGFASATRMDVTPGAKADGSPEVQ